MNHRIRRFILTLTICCIILSLPVFSETELPKNKQTQLGLYVSAQEAFVNWSADKVNIKIVDVRTPEEYVFIGHPHMAHNVPVMFLKEKWYAAEKGSMAPNPQFIDQIKKKFQPNDTLYLICRSGGRSAMAVNMLAEAGFKKVFTVTDGFEGGEIKDQNSYFNGKRMLNGWRNSGAPWTYEVDPELAFPSVMK